MSVMAEDVNTDAKCESLLDPILFTFSTVNVFDAYVAFKLFG